MLINLIFPSLAPKKTTSGSKIEAVNEQIMVLFWIILYKNIVSTYLFPLSLTICQTFTESSSPQEIILELLQFKRMAVTGVLLIGRLYSIFPSLFKL